MMTNLTARPTLRSILRASVAASLALALTMAPLPGATGSGGVAQAQTQGKGQGTRPPNAGQSMKGGGGSTKSTTEGDTSSDRKGPKYGGGANANKPEPGTSGTRPVWAKEGIPVVELGRLSVARAPAHVIEKALAEAVANWATMGTTVMTLTADGQPTLTMTVAQFYSLPAEQFANIVMTYYSSIVRIDSPLENLGLLQDLAKTGVTQLTAVKPASTIDLEAIFLGSASDKTIAISVDTVIAMNTILGLPAITTDQAAELAAKAEAVRLAILIGHDG
ncbi:MAG: hypothetical protein KGJ41_05565 [Rhodospirillales bacterium]|nr:hypothetical protein [Rhodospirillales bacterium]MDE2198473.1 hypothetical protein [Rhodospirillales bacterium]MDE2574311.1 hypothetical protein [Rhodospirillales bacterium]